MTEHKIMLLFYSLWSLLNVAGMLDVSAFAFSPSLG